MVNMQINESPLEIHTGRQEIFTHTGAEFVKVAYLNGKPRIWALGNANSPLESRTLVIRENGPVANNEHYIDTFFIDNVSWLDRNRGEHGTTRVCHVYEVKG